MNVSKKKKEPIRRPAPNIELTACGKPCGKAVSKFYVNVWREGEGKRQGVSENQHHPSGDFQNMEKMENSPITRF